MAHYSYIADHFGERHHVYEKSTLVVRRKSSIRKEYIPFVKTRFWQALLLYRPFSYLDGCDDGFRERLSIFFLHQSLDAFTVYLRGGRIILLILVQDDSVVCGLYGATLRVSACLW
jgi:hypothetical protein